MSLKDSFIGLEPEIKEFRYLKNTISYYKMLKEEDKEKVPLYKFELANFLSNMDIFLLKLRIILSIVGVIGSIISFFVIMNSFYLYKYNLFENLLPILFLYFFSFIGIFSYRVYKRSIFELNNLTIMIEK